MQRLLVPVAVATTLPLVALLVVLKGALHLPSWLVFAALLIHPVVVMGLVERRVRRRVSRERGSRSPSSTALASASVPFDRSVPLAMSLVGGALALAAALGAGKLATAAILGAGVVLVALLALRPRRGPKRLPSSEDSKDMP